MSRKGVEIHPINSIWAKQATKLEVQDVNKVSYWSSTVKQRISVSTSALKDLVRYQKKYQEKNNQNNQSLECTVILTIIIDH